MMGLAVTAGIKKKCRRKAEAGPIQPIGLKKPTKRKISERVRCPRFQEGTPANAASKLPGFIFQAEDGIRDYKVTGVQTCALPIYALVSRRQVQRRPRGRRWHRPHT